MIIKKGFRLFLVLISVLLIASCNKKEEQKIENTSSKEFSWKSELKISDIPDAPLKGFINGRELSINYINFEQWRGSGDHVINFGDVKPKNDCGYVENDNSFHLLHKAGDIKTGEFIKASFDQSLDGYISYYDTANVKSGDNKSSVQWNCALVITSMDDKTIKGKIAICFKDDKKSWLAGTFQAIRCYN